MLIVVNFSYICNFLTVFGTKFMVPKFKCWQFSQYCKFCSAWQSSAQNIKVYNNMILFLLGEFYLLFLEKKKLRNIFYFHICDNGLLFLYIKLLRSFFENNSSRGPCKGAHNNSIPNIFSPSSNRY